MQGKHIEPKELRTVIRQVLQMCGGHPPATTRGKPEIFYRVPLEEMRELQQAVIDYLDTLPDVELEQGQEG